MLFLPWHMSAAYLLDLVFGDPPSWPHPVRWIGWVIARAEAIFRSDGAGAAVERVAGAAFWVVVVAATAGAASFVIRTSAWIHPALGAAVSIWIAYTTLATRSLHQESRKVASALKEGDLDLARERVGRIVSRDTSRLDERDIIRALLETVSENISDGIVAPLLYLAIGGPVAAVAYKAVNTMDSMVGYMNERYRHFGWFAARADDVANWVPARLSGLLIVGAAALLKLNSREAWEIMLRDARKMKSPNAGFPEAAAAGALGIQLGGANVYFGVPVEKPTLGDAGKPLTLEDYRSMIRLMYVTSLLAFLFAAALRLLLCNGAFP